MTSKKSERLPTQWWRAPVGHKTHLCVFIDQDLLQYDEVWVAAGTWNDVFGVAPHKLVEASGGELTVLER